MLMRTRYDKDREPTMVARDGLAKALHRSHGSEADAAARGSATPVGRAERGSTWYALSPDEPRSGARDDARRSGLSATDDDSFGKADPETKSVACAGAPATTVRADNVCRN